MILIFDLDDTLYPERDFVLSGFRAVARHGEDAFGLDVAASFRTMTDILDHEGRGRVFDLWLQPHGLATRQAVARCVQVYRHHIPDIVLPDAHRKLLERLTSRAPLYLVTDGHKIAQKRKVDALRIAHLFRRVFITHRFGLRHAKPSLHCFDLIRRAERSEWNSLVYVGDNPAKDFVGLNGVGGRTVRVRTGSHAQDVAKPGHDAEFQIEDLTQIEHVLPRVLG